VDPRPLTRSDTFSVMRGGAFVALAGLFIGSGDASARAPETPALAADIPMLDHPERVVDYTLRAKLDPALHTVHGEGAIVWKNVSTQPVSQLWMHLYLNAFKNQSSVFMRAPMEDSAAPRCRRSGAPSM
jgi:hypothetical protein